MREPYLESDFLISAKLPAVYDTDLENFWTQASKYFKLLVMFLKPMLFLQIFKWILENFKNLNDDQTNSNDYNYNLNIQNQKFKVLVYILNCIFNSGL